jgi:hypothetical protein
VIRPVFLVVVLALAAKLAWEAMTLKVASGR